MDRDVITKVAIQEMDERIHFMIFVLRDKAGIFPCKVRVTMVFKSDDGGYDHTVEREQLIVDDLEEQYQQIVKNLALDEARKIVDDKNSGAE
jgi:hypothetical protein